MKTAKTTWIEFSPYQHTFRVGNLDDLMEHLRTAGHHWHLETYLDNTAKINFLNQEHLINFLHYLNDSPNTEAPRVL